jgi:ATP-binding cassette subfamily B protein
MSVFRRVWHHFGPFISKEWPLVIGSTLALLAEIAFKLLQPWPLKLVFDRVITLNPPAADASTLDGVDPLTLLALAAVAVVAIRGLQAVVEYAKTVGFTLVGSRVIAGVRAKLYGQLQRLPLSYHNKARGGDLIVRVSSDIGKLRRVAIAVLLPLVGNTLVLLGMVVVMVWLHWYLALVALLFFPALILTSARVARRVQRVSRKQREREGALAATTAESIGAIETVQALSLEKSFARSFARENRKSLKAGVKARRLAAHLARTVDLLVALATALVLYVGARLILAGDLTPGSLLVFLSYLRSAFRPVRSFAKQAGRVARATAAGERVVEVLEQVPEIRDLPGAVPAPSFRGAVSFDDVCFSYGPDRNALDGVSFEAQPGQRVAIVGPSGSGKSTLISLIPRLYDASAGRVTIDGCDVREYQLDSLRAQIAMVLQDSTLFGLSVRDNIALGSPDATDEDIVAAACLARAHDFIMALPDGYDTVLAERAVTLSGGQRQRLAIARAALRRTPILVLDEPTFGLDGESAGEVVEALERLADGRTTFLVTHDQQLAAGSDLVLYLDEGRLRDENSSTPAAGPGENVGGRLRRAGTH